MTILSTLAILVALISIPAYHLFGPDTSPHAFTHPQIAHFAAQGTYYNHHGRPVFTYDTATTDKSATTKPALLLLHGYPTSSIDWQYTIEQLQSKWHCVAYDYIGYGLSDKSLPLNTTIFTQADIAEELLLSRQIHSVDMLAHDVGVTVMQELMARQIDGTAKIKITSIVLLNGGLFPEQHRALLTQKALLTPYIGHMIQALIPRSVAGKALNKVFGKQTQLSDSELEMYTTLLYHNAPNGLIHTLQQYIVERRVNRERWVGAVQQITGKTGIPVRLINGPADPISGKHMIEYYKTKVPNPDCVLLDDHIGHYPQLEAPDQVLAAFNEFHSKLRSK